MAVETLDDPQRTHSRAQLRVTPNGEARDYVGPVNALAVWRSVARTNLLAVAAFSVVVNLLMLTLPIYLFQISDRVLTSRSLETLLMLSALALAFIGILSIVDILRRQVLGRLATKMEAVLGGAALASSINNARAGEGGTIQAIRSLHQVRGFISSPIMLLLMDAPLSPLYFAVIFLVHRHLGWIAVVSGLVLTLIALINQKATSERLSEAGLHAAEADAAAESLARNSQVINAMGMLSESILHWGRRQAPALTVQSQALDRNFWISGASKFVRLVAQITILGTGAYLALHAEITAGMMIAASIIAGRALQPLEGLIEGWRSCVQARSAYAHVKQAVESFQRETPKLRLPRPQGRLSVDRVLYLPPGSKEPVLNGVSLELAPGESLAIVGPSGSGKSTLARILVGCLVPTAGKVRLDGTELRNWDRRQFGEYTGYLPQEVELFPGTIKQNICRMRDDLPDESIYEAAMLSGIHDMVCQLKQGYETVLDRSGGPLSGGQKQRIALARAFFGNPSLVVLDEPNSNLDAAGEQALTETLQRAKRRGVSAVVVTLRPALLNSVDKVLILRAGRAEAFGSPSEVLHRLVRSPAGSAEMSRSSRSASSLRAGDQRGEDSMRVKDDIGEWYRGVPLSAKWPIFTGLAILVVWLGCFGIWAAIAPLNSAVVASGTFVATGQNKLVQHFEGGIIRDIAVKDGDVVEANQVLVRMDDTAANAKLRRLVLKKYRLLAMKARLEAELSSSDAIKAPAAFSESAHDPEIKAILERQRAELQARRASLVTEESVLVKQIAALEESIRGYQAQVQSTKERIGLFAEELKDKNSLLGQQLVRKSDVLALRRSEASLGGDLGEYLGRIADSKERIAQANERIAQLHATTLRDAIKELRETEAELDDVEEQMRAAQDVVDRIDVRSPVRGIVVKKNFHTPGGVVSPGAVILELLPMGDERIIEAHVNPKDISHVSVGQEALVRLSALNQRVTPMVRARVVYVSADTVAEQEVRTETRPNNDARRGYYVVRVRLDQDDVLRRMPEFIPTPGMPADVYIKTGERTFFEYIMTPVLDSFSRAFRET